MAQSSIFGGLFVTINVSKKIFLYDMERKERFICCDMEL